LRLLYLNHNPAGVGTWQRASHFGRAMAARGHQVILVTTHPRLRLGDEVLTEGRYTEIRTPDLFSGPARTGWDPSNALRRVLRLRTARVDLVHAFDSRPVVIAPAFEVVRRTGATLFMDWADWWGRGGRIRERSGWWVRTLFGPVETWFEERFRTRAHGTTTTSGALAARAAGLGVAADRIWTLPNGCDAGALVPGDRDEARRALGIPPGDPLVLHVGVLTPGDMAQLSRAVLLARAQLPDLRLVLVGNHTAPIPPEVLRSGSVQATGFVPRETLLRWLAAADVCVIPLTDTPNNRGRWPGRLNDYLAAGRPVVMPRVGDAAELIAAHSAGWTCGPEPGSLARFMLRALRDPDARAVAGERARALAAGPLAWPVLAERLEAAYRAVHDRRGVPGQGVTTALQASRKVDGSTDPR
jgi:glycosyltransferase involved in cell wall biosynthesis